MNELRLKEYVGRFIVLGSLANDSTRDVIVYGVTGRGEPSRERRFIWHGDTLEVQSIKEEEKNDPLRNYNAVIFRHGGVAVSNGRQIDLIAQHLAGRGLADMILQNAFAEPKTPDGSEALRTYEPDSPNFTPRISGAVSESKALVKISKAGDSDKPNKHYFELATSAGTGCLLSTYEGTNVPPGERIPPFEGNVIRVELPWKNAQAIAEATYEALGPKTGAGILDPGKDFRVGVAAFVYNFEQRTIDDMFIVNRHK